MAIENGYTTLELLKDHVEIDLAETDFDDALEDKIEAASRMIDVYCGRFFYDEDAAPSARRFRPDHHYELSVVDFHTTDGLVVKTDTTADGTFDTTWAASDYQTLPDNPAPGWPWNGLEAIDTRLFPTLGRRRTVEVTARWGWAAVPPDVAETCLIVAAELWARKRAPFGLVQAAEGTTERISAVEIPAITRLDGYRRI